VYAVWYPVKRQRDTDLWHARIARAVTQPTLAAEIWLHPRDTTVGLNGSGLLIVNPPWQSDIRLAAWQEELRELLGGGAGSGSAVKWIVHERN
jgi:23S rRNA (adenine2030-N6)-methyltransferase